MSGTKRPSGPAAAQVRRLSVYQQRIWRGHLAQGDSSYVVPCVFDVTGDIDVARLLEAVADVVDANPVLRSAVVRSNGEDVLVDSGVRLVAETMRTTTDLPDADACTVEFLRRPFPTDGSAPFTRLGVLNHADGSVRIAMAFHHVVTDGVSMDLVVQDIVQEYLEPGSVGLFPRPQYADVVGEPRGTSAAWWRSRLIEDAELRPWFPPATDKDVATTVDRGLLTVGPELAVDGVLTSAVWTAAVAVALSRMLDAEAVAFAVPVANRHELGEFEAIGPFINTVPLVVATPRGERIKDVVTRVDALLRETVEHADVDVDEVVASVRGSGIAPHASPTVFLNVREVSRPDLALGNARITPVALHSGEGKGALTVSVQTERAITECQVESALAGWDRDTHQGLRDTIDAVVRAWVRTPEIRCADIPTGIQGSPVDSTPPVPLVEMIQAHCVSRPDDIAVRAPDGNLTWAELGQAIDSARSALAEAGVGRGDRVLVAADRDLHFVRWAAGAMSLGAAYVPVDTGQGKERLRAIATTSGATVAIRGPRAETVLTDLGLKTLDRDATGATPVDAQGQPEDIAYVLFTSGSTGVPKGVAVPQSDVRGLIGSTTHLIGPDDVVSCIHSFTFDYSVWEVWVALAAGARVEIVGDDKIHDPFLLAPTLGAAGVTVLSLTNTSFGALLTACREEATASVLGDSVRRVILGGESVSPEFVRAWQSRFRHTSEIVNMLGATETTVHTTERVLTQEDADRSVVSVGSALSHLDVVVVDRHGQSLPTGVLGEIAVRGTGVTLGYLGRSRLTAERFVPDPYAGAAPGSRLYLTGDLGRWRIVDGHPALDCYGRKDSQVKVRGHRIELSGVEQVLDSAPEVARSCVIVHEGSLVAFVLLRETNDVAATLAEVRRHAGSHLADHEFPDRIDVISAFPATTTGKLDRDHDALMKHVVKTGVAAGAHPSDEESPADRGGRVLLGVLPEGQVDLGLSFAANGGDSIRAVEAVAELRRLGYRCSVADILSQRPLREIIHGFEPAADADSGPEPRLEPFALVDEGIRSALPADVSDAYPLSAAQQGMLFHVELDPEVGVYHNTVSVRIRGRLDERAFRVALDDTMRRHDVLRTAIDQELDLEPLQLVHRSVPVPFRFIDASEHDDIDALLTDLVAEERNAPFDLAAPPLFRMTLLRVGEEENQLIVSDSHIILDGWSWTSTIAEIVERHNMLMARSVDYDATTAPGDGVRFADFIALERAARADGSALDAWRNHLEGAIPTPIADRRGTGRAVERTRVPIDSDVDEQLRSRAARAGVSLRHLLMAVHYITMAEELGSSDLVCGVTSNGRLERPGGTDTRGMFLNMLPYRMTVPSGVSDPDALDDLARGCAMTEASLSPHRRLPLIDIQQALRKGPLFDHGFNFVRFHRLALVEKSHRFVSADEGPHYSREDTDLALMTTFSVHPPEHRLALMLIADTARVSGARVQRLAAAYQAVLIRTAKDTAR